MAIDTGMGFWGKMGQNLPGMINAAGSAMPGPWGATSRASGAMLNRPKKGGTTQQNGPSGMPPTGPNPSQNTSSQGQGGGIVRMPSLPIFGNPNGGGFFPPGRNTGITGGMFPPGGMMRPQPMPMQGMPPMGNNLWSAYNNLTDEAAIPNRQMFY